MKELFDSLLKYSPLIAAMGTIFLSVTAIVIFRYHERYKVKISSLYLKRIEIIEGIFKMILSMEELVDSFHTDILLDDLDTPERILVGSEYLEKLNKCNKEFEKYLRENFIYIPKKEYRKLKYYSSIIEQRLMTLTAKGGREMYKMQRSYYKETTKVVKYLKNRYLRYAGL